MAPGGQYDCGMDVGGFISFVLITLAYADDKSPSVLAEKDVKEDIYKLM